MDFRFRGKSGRAADIAAMTELGPDSDILPLTLTVSFPDAQDWLRPNPDCGHAPSPELPLWRLGPRIDLRPLIHDYCRISF
jgi:hypothetical protein